MVKLRLNAGHQDLAYRARTVQIPTMLTSTVAVPATARRLLPPVLQLQMSTVRSTMTDDYFSSLLIIAMEKDIADKISNERIIQCFAALSPVLAKHLLC